ncbi:MULTISPECIES: hypothetical protein [Campylobacter]|uniref:hypothetical protein n=1 Tax=Campylobacter TaxID=194 RepID=UPI0005821665|nr:MULTISPECIES: hypothetical protein [Campylobacter]AJC85516.1 hypothetical protein CPEL_b03 [Campylobacter peloridis LMG 23910]MCV3483451.1 hypothetical protein [Campylobacter sp. CNRCH_2014_0184h]
METNKTEINIKEERKLISEMNKIYTDITKLESQIKFLCLKLESKQKRLNEIKEKFASSVAQNGTNI